MDSDLPLIEIAGEDDSLLEQIPDPEDTHTIPNVSSTYFACSPLQLSVIKPRLSSSKGFKAKMDPTKPSCSATQSSSNKENINLNTSEVPKLSVEPLQMKKTKKGGGYNLRKSLAWDRAFDTDEGVLDPFELSMITGFSKSCREFLPVIKEGSNAIYASSNLTNKSEDSPDMNGTLKEDEEKGVCLAPRHTSLAQDNICSTPKATRKIHSTYGGAKSGSKGGGCPKPLAASSLKRPASASTVRILRKDSKLPKLPASKTGSCLLPTHTKSTTQYSSHLKPYQIAKPAVNVQKTVAAKCTSTDVKCAQIKAKTGPGVPAFRAKDSARNLTNSLLEVQSPTKSRPLQVVRANSASEVIRHSEVPSTRFHIREDQMSSVSPSIPLQPNLSVTNGKVINPKSLSMKPSGLRMPSPSMGFFGQSKGSGSETLMQRSAGPCDSNLESNIHITHKFGMSRPPPVPGKKPLIASSSNKQRSSSSVLCAVPDKTTKSDLGALTSQNMETEGQSVCKSSESSCWKQNGNGNIEVNPEVFQPVECTQLKEIVLKQDLNLQQISNNQVTLKGGSIEQREGDGGTELEHIDAQFPYEDRKPENGGAAGIDDFPDQSPARNAQQLALHGNLSSENEKCNSDSVTATEKNKFMEVCELSNHYPKCSESKSHREKENGGAVVVADVNKASSPSGHAQENAPDGNMSSSNYSSDQCTAKECTESLEVCELSEQRSKCLESTSHREHKNGGVVEVDYFSNKSPEEDAQEHASSTSKYPRGCLEVCDYSDKSAKKLEMKNVCFASEPTWQLNNEWQSDDSMLLVENSCSQKPHCKEDIDTVQFSFSERNDFSLWGSNVINMEVPGKFKDVGADADLVFVRTPIEETHVGSIVPPLSENLKHSSHKNLVVDVSAVDEAFSTSLSKESALLVQTAQPSSEGSNMPCKMVDQLSHNVVLEEAETQLHEDDFYNRHRMASSGGSLFQKSPAVEDPQFYLGDARDCQGCDNIMETSNCQIQTADQADKDVGRVDDVPESHLGAQNQLFKGDKLVGSCCDDTPISYDKSTTIACPVEEFGEHPELPDKSLKVQQVLVDNQDDFHRDSERSCKESPSENVENVPEDVHGCDLGTSGALTRAATADIEICHDFAEAQRSLDGSPSSSPVINSTDYNELSIDRRIIRSMESNSCGEVEDVRAECNLAISKDYLFTKKIIDSEEFQHDDVAESLADIPEGSFMYENDPHSSNVLVQAPVAADGIEYSEDGESFIVDGPSVPIKSSEENHDFFSAGEFSHDTGISGQAASGIDHDFYMNKDQILSLETTSELHHEWDNAKDLENDKDATLPSKSSENKMKLDIPLMKPPPNAVPFSDEWLAAIEAAGEDILTMKSGAVQNSPPDKSLPEPSPWSPVKRKNIQLGPFDCTKKLGNTLPGDPSS